MNAALRKTGALLAKDLSDLFKNPTMLVVCLLPIAFMALYSFMVGDAAGDAGITAEQQAAVDPVISQFMLGSSLCMTVGMVCTMTVLYAIAEEKEKRTLRTLMLANVGASQSSPPRPSWRSWRGLPSALSCSQRFSSGLRATTDSGERKMLVA